MKKIVLIFSFFVFAATSWSCNNGRPSKGNAVAGDKPSRRKAQVSIVSPANNARAALGKSLTLSAKAASEDLHIDSLQWFVDGKLLTSTSLPEITEWHTAGLTTGTHRIEVVAHYAGGDRDIVSTTVLLLAPQPPKRYTCRVVAVYPHDVGAYTQGLLYDGGFFYESTGLTGESTLRKVLPATGETIQSLNLPHEMFGEGLALVDDRLVQITWQNQTVFTYRKNDFNLLHKSTYAMKEGWGLTFDGEHLLMTDGTARLYFMDREYFTEVRRLEVCNHTGTIPLLNELEYINGELWANVYRQDEILRIDPKTGVVTGVIDMKGLLNAGDIKSDTDVLNGIAYDKLTGKIYVTGKKWPKLFEIAIKEKHENK
ncbi:MAG: glutaminyl-peptide cyclotransferase [Bacteroidales bacterium]|nr:glutaminyl-peptide cyclotransferase [Bacteroidales bacterium]